MKHSLALFIGRCTAFLIHTFKLGSGSTWPGYIALSIDKNFIKNSLDESSAKTIIVAGTNGKTTTSAMLQTIFGKKHQSVIQNKSGANLLSGIATILLNNSTINGKIKKDIAIFEADENTLPLLTDQITPDRILVLNLFRDQLDRYGEIHTIAKKWQKALEKLPEKTALILNADDPEVAYLGEFTKGKKHFFGLAGNKAKNDNTADSTYCPRCNSKLTIRSGSFSHLGDWSCSDCKLTRPKISISSLSFYPLSGTYNKYNTNAAVLTAQTLSISEKDAIKALTDFQPAFGRQEEIQVQNKSIKIFLSKNPTSFNQSLETIMQLDPKSILFVLNDRIPDGRDVSWIWDTEVEKYDFKNIHIFISGDRTYDMALRLKYAHPKTKHVDADPDLKSSIQKALGQTVERESLFILPTYSAMLEVRKILTGRDIL